MPQESAIDNRLVSKYRHEGNMPNRGKYGGTGRKGWGMEGCKEQTDSETQTGTHNYVYGVNRGQPIVLLSILFCTTSHWFCTRLWIEDTSANRGLIDPFCSRGLNVLDLHRIYLCARTRILSIALSWTQNGRLIGEDVESSVQIALKV